jgi:deoxycytidylate deaminase
MADLTQRTEARPAATGEKMGKPAVKTTPPEWVLHSIKQMASYSNCKKSQRGVVIWRGQTRLGGGCNKLLRGECDNSEECRRVCNRRCLHAEQEALWFAVNHPEWKEGRHAALLHAKVKDGEIVHSGGPSCMECAKLVLRVGIGHVWLLEEDGWHVYTAEEFYEETCRNVL